jgi:hypothetical protein
MRTDAGKVSSAAFPAVRAEGPAERRAASPRNVKRPWYAGLRVVPLTIMRTFAMLRNNDLGSFVPFVALLFMGAGVLWLVNAIAPLAPLIYSLF